jgi:hypothetical protein
MLWISSVILIAIFFTLFNTNFIIFANAQGYDQILKRFDTELKCNSIPINYKEIVKLLRDANFVECNIPGDLLQELDVKTRSLIECVTGKLGSEGCVDFYLP